MKSPHPESGGTVLVTGASSGVGRATALLLAEEGLDVVAAMRQPMPLAAPDGRVLDVLPLDLTRPASIAACAEAVLARGPLRLLVNAAGIPCLGAMEELPVARLREAMEVNFFGTLALCGAVAGALRRQGRGGIVNLSSSLGAAALPLYGGYCAIKAALEAATEALRYELAPFGVVVRLLRPGLIATPFGVKRQAQAPDAASPYADRLDRPEPEDLGSLVSMPQEVAFALLTMLAEPDGPFRMTVGEDSRRWVANRRRLHDAEFFRGVERDGYAFA